MMSVVQLVSFRSGRVFKKAFTYVTAQPQLLIIKLHELNKEDNLDHLNHMKNQNQ